MFKLRVKGSFEAAHSLSWHEKCREVHGHSYHVEVVVGAETLDENGIVMDLGELKALLGRALAVVDHTNLDDWDWLLPYPTAEVIAAWFYRWVGGRLRSKQPHVCMVEVTVWETDDGGVTYDG
jgi:6-pyruvoyltetrahydropterin/6-carboxytetrahydropterin synthase